MTRGKLKAKMETPHMVVMRLMDWRLTVNALDTCVGSIRGDGSQGDEGFEEWMRGILIDIRDSVKEQVGIN